MSSSRSLAKHPIREPHPWGEHRTWCSRCGAPAWVDDLAFHVHHVDDGSDASVWCARRLTFRRRLHLTAGRTR